MRYYTGVPSLNGGMHHAHSAYALYLMRTGIIGLIVAVIILFLFARMALRRHAVAKSLFLGARSSYWNRQLALASMAVVFAIYVLALSVKSNIWYGGFLVPLAFAWLMPSARSIGR